MKHTLLTKETNEIQRVVALRHSRNKRFQNQEFIIEGILNINQAIKHNWPIKSIFYNHDTQLSEWAKTIISNKSVYSIYAVSENIMRKISEREDCPEVLMIGQAKSNNFSNYSPSVSEVVIVLDQPKSAGNLGMIIRSAAAFGVNAIVISGHAADEYDPQCIRSSVGSFFNIPIFTVEGVEKFRNKIEQLKVSHNLEIISSGNKGSVSLHEHKFSKYLLFIIFGNETHEVTSFDKINDGFESLIVPAQQYVKFTNQPGPMPSVCVDMWKNIWKMEPADLGGKRAYIADFEVYDERSVDHSNVTLDIYIGIAS